MFERTGPATAIVVLVLLCHPGGAAQAGELATVTMHNGKLVLFIDGVAAGPMTNDVVTDQGLRIAVDGTITDRAGRKTKMTEDQSLVVSSSNGAHGHVPPGK